MSFNRESFKNQLLSAGYDWSDEKIDNYIAYKNAGQNLAVEQVKYNNAALYDLHRKWESGTRAQAHNNFGAHIWTPTLQNKFGATKGTSFQDRLGNTLYTAKYDTIERGDKANKYVIDSLVSKSTDATDYVLRYTGLEASDESAKNYINDVSKVYKTMEAISPTQTEYRGSYIPESMTDESRNSLYDAVGNLAWQFADMTTFGVLGAADPERLFGFEKNSLQKALTGVNPGESAKTFGGRVGQGIGGAAGFLYPMGAVKKFLTKAASYIPKIGTNQGVKKIIKKGSTFLGAQGGKQAEQFNKMNPLAQKDFFSPILGTAFKTRPLAKEASSVYKARWRTNLEESITTQLQRLKVQPIVGPKGNVTKLADIVEDAAFLNGKDVLRPASLQEIIAVAIGGGVGAGKVANFISHAVEEAVLFTAVETPMEVFSSFNEDRKMDLPGTVQHAVTLGSILGLVKLVPGGKDWGSERGILRSGYNRFKRAFNSKRDYDRYDLSNPDSRRHLAMYVEDFYHAGGKMILNNGRGLPADFKKITHISQIRQLAKDEKGAKQLVQTLKNVELAYKKQWKTEFWKEAGSDIAGSFPRMLAGSMAFNYSMVFEDQLPLEDKVFHIALGAFMSKPGRRLRYIGKDGTLHTTETGNYKPVGSELVEASKYLDHLGMPVNDHFAKAMINSQYSDQRLIKTMEENADIKLFNKIMEDSKVIDSNNGSDRQKAPENTRGKIGAHPIYETAKLIYDGSSSQKTKLVGVESLTVSEIQAIEKKLKNTKFEALDGATRGIQEPNDIFDIKDRASDKTWSELQNLYIETSEAVQNALSTIGAVQSVKYSNGQKKLTFRHINPIGNLSEANNLMLEAHHRHLDMLAKQGAIILDRSKKSEIRVDEKRFKESGVDAIFADKDGILNELIRPDIEISKMMRSESLLQEGTIDKLMEYQGHHRGVRLTHDKLTDLFNGNKWNRDEGSLKHHGEEVESLIKQIFTDTDGANYLYTDLKFGPKVNQEVKDFSRAMLKMLRRSPDPQLGNVSMLKTLDKVSPEITQTKDIRKLMSLFEKNSIVGFSKNNDYGADVFLESYSDYEFKRRLGGLRKGDGSLLNPSDRAVILNLTENRLLGKNFSAIEIIGPLEAISQQVDMKSYNPETLLGAINNSKANNLQSSLKTIANERSLSTQELGRQLIKDYNDIIKPYLYTDKGGFIKFEKAVAQVEIAQLNDFIAQLDYAKKAKNNITHADFEIKLEALRNSNGLDKASQQHLDELYGLYATNQVSANKIMNELSKYKLYDLKEGIIEVDFDNPTLAQDMASVLRNVQTYAQTDFTAKVEQNLNRYRNGNDSKKTEIETERNFSRQSFIKDYRLGDDYQINNRDYNEIKKDLTLLDNEGKVIKYEDFNIVQQKKADSDLIQATLNSGQTIVKHKINLIENQGLETTPDQAFYDNSFFKHLREASGKDKNNNTLGLEFDIVDMDIAMSGKRVANAALREGDSYIMLQKELAHASTVPYFDSKSNSDAFTNKAKYITREGSVLIELADHGFGFAIQKHSLPAYGKNFKEKMDVWKKEYSSSQYGGILQKLQRKWDNLFKYDKDSDTYELREIVTKSSEDLQTLINHTWMDSKIPKYYWNELSKTENGTNASAVADLLVRQKLMSNVSMKELSGSHIEQVRKVYNTLDKNGKFKYSGGNYNAIRKGLKKIKDTGTLMDVVIAEDAGLPASLIFKAKERFAKEIGDSKTHKEKDFYQDKFGEDLTFLNGKDISDVDSYVAVSKQKMDQLYTILGLDYNGGYGGIKPLIHRYGNEVIIGKTAFVYGGEYEPFFKNNKNVDAIMFKSAAKVNYDSMEAGGTESNVLKYWGSNDGLNKMILAKEVKIESLKPEDVSLGAVVARDHDATISYQKATHLSSGATSEAFFDTYLRKNVEDWGQMLPELFSPYGGANANALARHLNAGKTDQSIYSNWVEQGGLPTASYGIKDNFLRALKSEYLDKGVLKIHTQHGGQSVLSPGTDLRYFNPLKDGSTYTYGQAMIPHVAGEKLVNLDRLNIVQNNPKGKDNLVKIDALKDFAMPFKEGNKVYAKDLIESLRKYSETSDFNYEMAAVYGRNPSTRPGDTPIVGIKGVLGKEFGNQTKINAWDLAMRLEGDYDIDKADFWWDSPDLVLKEYDKMSGRVIRVVPDGAMKKTSVPTNLDWLDASTINQWKQSNIRSQKLLGNAVKLPRLLRALHNYNSTSEVVNANGSPVKGLVISRGSKDGGQRIYINTEKLEKTIDRLGTDIQNIVDAKKGFNRELYNSDPKLQLWTDKVMFGDGLITSTNSRNEYSGIFGRAIWNEKASKWITNESNIDLSKTEQAIVKEVIAPYRQMLQLGSSLYSSGKAKSVRYEDIMTGMSDFDADMKTMNKDMYYRLLKGKDIDASELNAYFLLDAKKGPVDNNWSPSLIGNFGESIRPGFKSSGSNIGNMSVFEKTLSYLKASDKSSLATPQKLYGVKLKRFNEFYENSLYGEKISQYTGKFISALKENNDMLSYANALDAKIVEAKITRSEARADKNQSYVDYQTQKINDLEMKKLGIENEMLKQSIVTDKDGVVDQTKLSETPNIDWARKLRSDIAHSIEKSSLQELRTPKKWGKSGLFSKEGELLQDTKFRSYEEGKRYFKKHKKALQIYAKKEFIQFKGISKAETLDNIIMDSILKEYTDKYLSNPSSDLANKVAMDAAVIEVSKLRKGWADYHNGSNHTLNQNKVGNAIQREIRKHYNDFENDAINPGQGRLFLWNLMKPKQENFKFTYFNGEIMPAYQRDGKNMIREVLQFISDPKNTEFTEFERNRMIKILATSHREASNAFYGNEGERSTLEENIFTNMSNDLSTVSKGAPLIDNIKGYNGGIQEADLNPNTRKLFGLNDSPLAYSLSHSTFDPKIIKKLGALSYMSYMPKGGLIPGNNITNHPSINGVSNYFDMKLNNDIRVMLGDKLNLNLMKSNAPKTINNPLGDMHKTSSTAKSEGYDIINKKKGC